MKENKQRLAWILTVLIMTAANAKAEAQKPTLAGTTHSLEGTLFGTATEIWTGRGVQKGSKIRVNISSLTTINFPCANAWPKWKALISFKEDGTFSYWDIDTDNPQANTTPLPVVPKVNDNWRSLTGTWTQKGGSVRLILNTDPKSTTGENALYRFYGVSTQPALPPAPPSFQGQAATVNTPALFTGTESPSSADFYFTYNSSFKNNPAYNHRSYVWKGLLDRLGHLKLDQSTIYQISDFQDVGFVSTNAEAPPPDLYSVSVRWIFTKSLRESTQP